MATPLFTFSNHCCGYFPAVSVKNEKTNITDVIYVAATAFDIFISLTALVVGILGAISVFAMPPAAAYSLIALSGTITLLWIVLCLQECSAYFND